MSKKIMFPVRRLMAGKYEPFTDEKWTNHLKTHSWEFVRHDIKDHCSFYEYKCTKCDLCFWMEYNTNERKTKIQNGCFVQFYRADQPHYGIGDTAPDCTAKID